MPFKYGLETSDYIIENSIISNDIPSECARKLIHDEADIGLVPVAAIPEIPSAEIISDYCLSSNGNVETVLLLSDVPVDRIERIYLDYHSRTSVKLVKILCRYYWRINPEFIPASENYEKNIQKTVAGLVIGDRAFKIGKQFGYQIDLSNEWIKFKNMPFVFAAWDSNKKLPKKYLIEFNKSIKKGTSEIDNVINSYSSKIISDAHLKSYLTESIRYELDDKKREAINVFLELAAKV